MRMTSLKLKDMWQRNLSFADVKTSTGLNDNQCAEFLDLAQEFFSLFSEAPETMNLVQTVKHQIHLMSHESVSLICILSCITLQNL